MAAPRALALLRQVSALRGSVPVFQRTSAELHRGRDVSGFRGTATDSDQEERFPVPLEKLQISFSRSSGAGGQHVNKVSSRAEVRFHVQTADWLPEALRREMLSLHQSRINKAGHLCVRSEVSRSQHRNLQECVKKISELINQAEQKLISLSEEREREVDERMECRLQQWNERRLQQKKIAAAVKKSRRIERD